MVPVRPFFTGSRGWVRSSAWTCDFSSIDSTTARAGGSKYKPTISVSFSAKAESLDNVKPADAYFGRDTAIIERKNRIKKLTVHNPA